MKRTRIIQFEVELILSLTLFFISLGLEVDILWLWVPILILVNSIKIMSEISSYSSYWLDELVLFIV